MYTLASMKKRWLLLLPAALVLGPLGYWVWIVNYTSLVASKTILEYQVSSQIGGKIAQVGSRLIDSVARKLAEDFFTAFEAQIAPPAAVEAAERPPRRTEWASNPWVWAGIIAAGIVVLVALRLALR